MNFKNGKKEKRFIVKCGVDQLLPFAITFGLYIILFGTVSPGGGFQGGVIVASAVLFLYLGHGYAQIRKAFNPDVLRIGEALAATAYVCIGMLGIIYGYNFCRNVFYNDGAVGEMISGGTITFMSWAVGFKVMTGVSFLLILLLGAINPESEDMDGYVAEEDEK